jgi:CheY-like chemotaxis protein
MSIDDTVKLIEASAKLGGALVWPCIVLFVLLRFGPALRGFFADLSEFTFKGAGFEASAKRRVAEAAAAMAAAVLTPKDTGAPSEASLRNAKAAAAAVATAATSQAIRRAGRSTTLWVNDRPQCIIYERQGLEALGMSTVVSTSTEDAVEKVKLQKFDVIISDMRRPPDDRAGYTLLKSLRSRGDDTPFIIYPGSRAPEHQEEARRRGAVGTTDRPDELVQMVLSALGPSHVSTS